MNTRPYEYLLAISENGSLSKAAQALGISQPTLSNFLSGTERQMGHALFERSGRVLIPTEAGLIYLDTCRRILEVISQTYHAIASLEDRYREAFTVGVTPYRGSQVFSVVGVFFSKDHVLTKAQRYFIYLITRLQAKSSQNGSTYLNETAKKILREFEKG